MQFDPYRDWLDLPDGPRPPHPYALLGLPVYERDADRIAAAAAERSRQIRRQATFDRVSESQKLLAEVRAAAALLTDSDRRRRLELQMRRTGKSAAHGFPRRPPVSIEESNVASAGPEWLLTGAAGLLAIVFASGVIWSIWQFRDRGGSSGALVQRQPLVEAGDVEQAMPAPARNVAGQKAVPPLQPRVDVAKNNRTAVKPVPDEPADVAAIPLPPLPALPDPGPTPSRSASERAPVVAQVPLLSKTDWQAAARAAPPPWSPVEASRPALPSLAFYRFPAFDSQDDAVAYASYLERLLEGRADTREGSEGQVEQHHRGAVEWNDDTALTHYVLGLIHLQKLRLDEAAACFDRSRGPVDSAFLPGWQAFIQLEMRRNRRDSVLKNAAAFAEALAVTDGEADAVRARDKSIRWLGRLTAVLESPWDADALPPQDLVDADAAIRESLGPELTKDYEEGRRSLRDDVAVRAEATRLEIERLSSAHGDQQTHDLDAIAAERESAQSRQNELDRRADEAAVELREQTTRLDGELGKLRPQYDQLAQQVQSAQSILMLIDTRIAQELQVPPGDRPPIAGYESSQLLAARQQAQVQHRQASDRLARVQQQVDSLTTQRQQLVGLYEREARTLAAERNALRKHDGMLDRRAAKTGAVEASGLPAIQGYQRRLRDVASYLPFDVDEEARNVLTILRSRLQQSRS